MLIFQELNLLWALRKSFLHFRFSGQIQISSKMLCSIDHWSTLGRYVPRSRGPITVSNQCDQIERFLKVLGKKVPCKSSPNIRQHFWANVKNCTFYIKQMYILFGQLLEKIGELFTLTSRNICLNLLNRCLPTFVGPQIH